MGECILINKPQKSLDRIKVPYSYIGPGSTWKVEDLNTKFLYLTTALGEGNTNDTMYYYIKFDNEWHLLFQQTGNSSGFISFYSNVTQYVHGGYGAPCVSFYNNAELKDKIIQGIRITGANNSWIQHYYTEIISIK